MKDYLGSVGNWMDIFHSSFPFQNFGWKITHNEFFNVEKYSLMTKDKSDPWIIINLKPIFLKF